MLSRQGQIQFGQQRATLPQDQPIDERSAEELILQEIQEIEQLRDKYRRILETLRGSPEKLKMGIHRAASTLRDRQFVALQVTVSQFDQTVDDASRTITDAAQGAARIFEEMLSRSSASSVAPEAPAVSASNDEVLKAIADLARRVDALMQSRETTSSADPSDVGEDDDPQTEMFTDDRKKKAKPKKHRDEIFASTHPRFREATTVARSALIAGGIPLPAKDLARIIREAIPEFNVDGKSVPNRLLKMDLVRVAKPNRPRPVKFWWGPDLPEGYERAG